MNLSTFCMCRIFIYCERILLLPRIELDFSMHSQMSQIVGRCYRPIESASIAEKKSHSTSVGEPETLLYRWSTSLTLPKGTSIGHTEFDFIVNERKKYLETFRFLVDFFCNEDFILENFKVYLNFCDFSPKKIRYTKNQPLWKVFAEYSSHWFGIKNVETRTEGSQILLRKFLRILILKINHSSHTNSEIRLFPRLFFRYDTLFNVNSHAQKPHIRVYGNTHY